MNILNNIKNIGKNIFQVIGPPLNNNSYIIINGNFAIVIDPSYSSNQILTFLKMNNISNIAILITHFHFDHIGYSNLLLDAFNDASLYIGKQETKHVNDNHSDNWNNIYKNYPNKIIFLDQKQATLKIFDMELTAFHCPAHTLGSYTYTYQNYFFTGDFIFSDCIGFFDEKYIDGKIEFKKSMDYLAKQLNDDSIICPGHGYIDKWNNVKKENIELKEYWENVR